MNIINTVPLTYFIDELMLLDGMEQHMAEDYVRKAIIEFCRKTQVLRRITEIELIECANEYLLDLNEDERVVSIQEVCGYEVLKNEPCNLPNCNRHYVWFVPPNNLMVSPTPVKSGGRVRVVVSVTPQQDFCEVDELIYENYREVIIDKALSMLYKIKQARWYDLQLAVVHEKSYNIGVVQAGADRLLGVRRGKIRMKAGNLYG